MNRTIIDVTQLVHWPGNLTGVPRVMHELAIRFQAQGGPDAIFASWVKEVKAMCEIDLTATLAQRGQGIVYKTAGGSTGHVAASPSPGAIVKKTAFRALKKGIRLSARVYPGLGNKLEARALRFHARTYTQLQLGKGDTLVVLWGEWWDTNFIALLQTAKQNGARIAHVIHDMTPIVVPHLSGHSTQSYTHYCHVILPIIDLGLMVSQSAKRDTTEWLKQHKLPVPPMRVFRLGDDFKAAKAAKPQDPAFVAAKLKGQDFLMFVSTIEARKNHMLIYYVYRLAKERGITLPTFLVVGRRGWKTDEMYELWTTDPLLKNNIIFLHNINDAQLSWLYEHCLFTVSPSYYEGWGITIAESIARGVPCLASSTSSVPEIAPGFMDYFSPYSTDECLAGIQRMLQPGVLAQQRKKVKGYKPTSWDDTYKQMAGYLEELEEGRV